MEQTLETRPEHLRLGSAASWTAIFAGAFVAASVSLVLLTLGTGLGLAEISPWPGHGASAGTFAVTTAIWLVVMQWLSSGVGGYITGRLRTRWIGTHTHEVFFRDTAHGLITWSVATVLVATVVASSLFSAIQGGAHAVGGAAQAAVGTMSSGAAPAAQGESLPGTSQANAYGVDKLFRSANASSSGASGDPRIEVTHIVTNAWSNGAVSDEDRNYLAELVAARTGASQADARKRVDEFAAQLQEAVTKAKAEADAARKSAAEAAIYTALSMLIGAFIASISAALGGRLRDEHYM